jgi:hypothetical protein
MKTIDLATKPAALAYLSGLDPSTTITLPDRFDSAPHDTAADAVAVLADEPPYVFAADRNRWEWTIGELIADLHPAANYEIVFDNGGGATLQTHDGRIAINYSDMEQLASDASFILNGEEADGWDGIEPEHFISDEQYEQHASNGGYLAIQLDPRYRHNWPDADETGWNNLATFLRALP